jgi:hypothetical protein
MNTKEFFEKAIAKNYVIHLECISGTEVSLNEFIDFGKADLDLKIYLNKLIFNRCFYGTGYVLPADLEWFVQGFFQSFERDLLKPELTSAINLAVEMIFSEDTWGKCILGTTFMFGVIEFYAKYKLGFRPNLFDFFDKDKKSYIQQLGIDKQDLSISSAIDVLKTKALPISAALNEIDHYRATRLTQAGIEADKRWTRYKISERVGLARNTMLHGERHGFYDMGHYLSLLYTLFYLCDLKEREGEK